MTLLTVAYRAALIALASSVVALAWRLGGGPSGLLYLILYTLATLPGLPLGFALFGRSHAAGWVTGAIVGYGLTALLLWAPVQAGAPPVIGITLWAIAAVALFALLRNAAPLVSLPPWSRRDSLALLLVLLLVPALLWAPFTAIGSVDADGSRRYRAYFTADFLWHVALTAELERAQAPPRNPYLARRPLNYYWAYFVLPATVARSGVIPSLQAVLTLNALCAGLVFVSAVFMAAWSIVPRAGPVAAAVALAILCASAEGAYAIRDLLSRGRPLDVLRETNVDAITAWFFSSQTIDSLPRSLWYTPQHAAACALGLTGLIVAAAASVRQRLTAALIAGVALGLSLVFSPFLGGVFAVIYGVTAVFTAWRSHGRNLPPLVGDVARSSVAAVPVLAGLAWCIAAGTFEGAGGALAIRLSSRAAAAPLVLPLLSLGPVLIPAIGGTIAGVRRWPLHGALVALGAGFFLLYFVTLTLEPIWVGWRAGQVILVTIPALVASMLAWLSDRSRTATVATALVVAAAGLPTTVIDWFNAHDVANDRMGPGFRWTVVVPPDTQAVLHWIRDRTPHDALVQMSIGPRGRETWTLVPTFAERRMAAGKPISLLAMPEYDERSRDADAMFQTGSAAEAWRLARALRLDYVYLDRVERQAFGEAAAAKFEDRQYFTPAFGEGTAAVFAVK